MQVGPQLRHVADALQCCMLRAREGAPCCQGCMSEPTGLMAVPHAPEASVLWHPLKAAFCHMPESAMAWADHFAARQHQEMMLKANLRAWKHMS